MNKRGGSITVQIRLYRDGEEILYQRRKLKKDMIRVIRVSNIIDKHEYDHGSIKLFYNRKKDYWNEFEFDDREHMVQSLKACLEPEMIRDFV